MVQSTELKDFFQKSRDFYHRHKRPVSSTNSLESLVQAGEIDEHDALKYVQTNRILVHPAAKQIAKLFLQYKRTFGTEIEKETYHYIDWDLERFLKRLIKKRPLCFFGAKDTTLLRDGVVYKDATSNWDRCGTESEGTTINMRDYLTYDEMMISSLIGVSGYTAYLNDGRRDNMGVQHFQGTQTEGIQIGLVGARFERSHQMDSMYMFDRPEYSNAFMASMFPGKTFEQRYKFRIRISIETMLAEADARGAKVQRKTWVHAVGLGLGVWKAQGVDQQRWYIEAFAQAMYNMKIHWIGVLEFPYIDMPKSPVDHQTKKRVEEAAALSNTKVIWSQRNPSEQLKNSSYLLVTTYAWDSNSYPGNEYFMGKDWLSASGDPAAAASSLIAETQNPEINTWMSKNIEYLKV